MKYQDYYNITLRINGNEVFGLPTNFSFSMQDSIYHLFNTLRLSLSDYTGFLQEYPFFTEGAFIEINFGIEGLLLKNNYVVCNESLEQQNESRRISGTQSILAKHKWFNEQNIKSKGYRNNIHLLVQQLISPSFLITNIDPTQNTDNWIQALQTDADFIEKTLLPNAFSNKVDNTPFLCYISNNESFNFLNIKSLFNALPIAELEYSSKEDTYYNKIISINRYTQGSKLKDLRHRKSFHINPSTGEVEFTLENLTNYLSSPNKYLPIQNDLLAPNNITGVDFDRFLFDNLAYKNNKSGRGNFNYRKSYFLDRLIITTPFRPDISAGDKLTINIDSYMNQDSTSVTKSGDYIVESSRHIWNAERQQAFSNFIVGRKYTNLPGNYKLIPSYVRGV